jgi:hypothetical protein
MQKILSPMSGFGSALKQIVMDPKRDCRDKVSESISELKKYTQGYETAFHRIINGSIEEIAVAANPMMANNEKEYNVLVRNVMSSIGLLFDVSLKDEKVANAITERLRRWQTEEIEESLREYKDRTKLRLRLTFLI